MKARLRRLRAMPREEIAFRTRTAAGAWIDRLASAVRPPRWNRAAASRVLAAYVLDGPMRQAIGRQDWNVVQRGLERTIRDRPSRFVIDPAAGEALRRHILHRWPAAADDARARAERIAEGDYDLLGYRGLRFGANGEIDWHLDPVSGRRAPRTFWTHVPFLDPAVGDHKVIWELNRHQHWLALGRALWLTGDVKYRREIVAQLDSWLAANPPRVGINWASMLELGFRSLSWVAALHLLLGAPAGTDTAPLDPREAASTLPSDRNVLAESPWLVDLLIALHSQMEHVARNLSLYFSPNTHLLGEALALYVVGQSLPELSRSPHWADLGRRILLEQIGRQVERDGGHAERSLHYHRYAHDFYLLALLTAERCGDDHAAAAFREVAGRMAVFLREAADDNSRLPLIGDDDGGMLWPIVDRDCADARGSLSLAAAVLDRPELAPWGPSEDAVWQGWSTCPERLSGADSAPVHSRDLRVTVFPDTGYVIARDGERGHLVLDAGPHGFLNCGHAHADALALTLAVDGRPLLIDPGTGSYTADPAMRDRLRRTANHNTVTLAGQSSSAADGPFHWRTKADARLHASLANPRFGWIEASHDGYPAVRHRRSLVRMDGGWLVLDELLGERTDDAEVHWHFDPQWTVEGASGQALAARHRDDGAAWLVHDACPRTLAYGDEQSGLGWCSPCYGAVVPTWSVRLCCPAGGATSMATWIGAAGAGERPPVLDRLSSGAEGGPAPVSLRLRRDARRSTIAVRPGDAAPAGYSGRAGEYHTDARLLAYTVNADGALESLAMADGTTAFALREGLLSLASDVPVGDIHAAIRDRCLDVHSSAPPPQLRLQGRVLDALSVVRLNGRIVPLPRRTPESAVVIARGEWPARAADPGVDLCVA